MERRPTSAVHGGVKSTCCIEDCGARAWKLCVENSAEFWRFRTTRIPLLGVRVKSECLLLLRAQFQNLVKLFIHRDLINECLDVLFTGFFFGQHPCGLSWGGETPVSRKPSPLNHLEKHRKQQVVRYLHDEGTEIQKGPPALIQA